MSQKHYSIRVTGLVQGVFFRSHARKKADELGLSGFVRNEDDGSVLIEVEGEESMIQAFLRWCHEGSPGSAVKQVEIREGALVGYDTFTVQR